MPSVVTVTDREVAAIRPGDGQFGQSAIEEYLPDFTYRAIQRYLCDWSDRDTVVAQASAEPYPHKPDAKAWLHRATIVGVGKAGISDGLLTYEKALVTLYFSTIAPAKTAGALWVTETLRDSYMAFPVSGDGLHIGSTTGTSVPSQSGLMKPVAGLYYRVVFHHVQSPPATIVSLKDYCNEGVFHTLTFGLSFAPQTVWYRDCHVHRTIALGGGFDFQVSLGFLIRPASWNAHWFPGHGWQYVYTSSGQVLFHPLGNINIF